MAVTGHEAHDVSRKAAEFERRLDRIQELRGKEKEAAMKPYLVVSVSLPGRCDTADLEMKELGQSGISLIKKHRLKERFDKISSDVAALAKAKVAADQKMVREPHVDLYDIDR